MVNNLILIFQLINLHYNKRVFPGGRFDDGDNFEETLIREINEETGIRIVKTNDDNYEFINSLEEKIKVIIEPFMLYESVYPDFIKKGLPTAQCLALFYKIIIDTDKNYIDIKYQKDEVCSFSWINFDNLYSALYEKEKLIFDSYEYQDGNNKPFKTTICDENILINWEKEGLGIPFGHVLAIKYLYNRNINK